jgi:hypothetical protein
MIPLWLDGAFEIALNTDQRCRYDTLSEFIFDLTHQISSFYQSISILAGKLA